MTTRTAPLHLATFCNHQHTAAPCGLSCLAATQNAYFKPYVLDETAVQGLSCGPLCLIQTSFSAAVSAYVTHGVFPNQTFTKFKADTGDGAKTGFRYFWLTDSCPQTVRNLDAAPFEVLTLADPIAAALQI